MDSFHFLRPEAFWLLLPCAGCVAALYFFRSQSQSWLAWFDPELIKPLLQGNTAQQQRWPLFGLSFLWFIGCVALAGPTWERLKQPVVQSTASLVIVWDMSPSMNAADLRPNRLTRSRFKLTDLLNARKEGQTALIVYGGEAHVVAPLSDDSSTLLNQLPALSPELMPIRGSNTEMAIEKALQLFRDAGITNGDILLVTDGVVKEAAKTIKVMINKAKSSVSARLFVYGIGTEAGAPVPFGQGFAKDDQGNIIVDTLDSKQLQQLALDNGGQYISLSRNNRDIEQLSSIQAMNDAQALQENPEQEREFDAWKDSGVWLLWLILPLTLAAFRKGWVFSVLALTVFYHGISPQSAYAENSASASQTQNAPKTNGATPSRWWDGLWRTPNQQGQALLEQGQHQAAAERFEDNQWKASAHYRSGDFAQAADHFDPETAKGAYNKGTALAKAGDLEGALTMFDRALEIEPNFKEAQENRSIVQKLKESQPEPPPQQGEDKNQDQDGEKQDQGSGENQNQDGRENQDQSNGENQNQDGSENQDQSNGESQSQDGRENQNQSDGENQPPNKQSSSQSGENDKQPQEDSQQESASENPYAEKDPESSDKPAQTQGSPQEDLSQKETELTEPNSVSLSNEEQEANAELEQWLKQIPDDPSGLLRNKFDYQYRQRRQQYRSGEWKLPSNKANQRL